MDNAETNYNPEEELEILSEGIEILADDIQQLQDGTTVREKVLNGCTEFHETLTEELKRIGFKAMTFHETGADVDYGNQTMTGRARGHAVGLVVTRDGLHVLAYDATIAQSAVATDENETVRIWRSECADTQSQLMDLATQLRSVFGGDWDYKHMQQGLDLL